jgi:hypothetical protein
MTALRSRYPGNNTPESIMKASRTAESCFGGASSVIGETKFAFDDEIVTAKAYRRVFASAKAMAKHGESPLENIDKQEEAKSIPQQASPPTPPRIQPSTDGNEVRDAETRSKRRLNYHVLADNGVKRARMEYNWFQLLGFCWATSSVIALSSCLQSAWEISEETTRYTSTSIRFDMDVCVKDFEGNVIQHLP